MKINKTGNKKLKINEVCDLIKGTEPGSKTYNDKKDGVRFIRVADISRQKADSVWTSGNNLKICRKNDILMAFDGSPGAVFRGIEGAISSGIRIIRTKDSSILTNNYLYYYLKSSEVQNIVKRYTVGASILHASRSIPYINVLIPPLNIQHKITAILEACESAIQKRKETNRLTDEFLKSTFLEMFGDPVRNTYGWNNNLLGKLSLRITKGESPKWQGFSYQNMGIRFITSENVLWGDMDIDNIKYIPQQFHNKLLRSQLKKKDLLINLVGASIGRACLVNKKVLPANVNQAVAVITLNQEALDSLFTLHQILHPGIQALLSRESVEAARANISLTNLRELVIIIPPLNLQQKFADIVQKVEKIKQKQRESEIELTNLFNSLMQRAFREEL